MQYAYLALIVSGKKCTVYLHEDGQYSKLGHGPESISEVVNDAPSRVANFSDPKERKQITVNKFLHGVDKWLETVIHQHPLPIFLLAPEKVAGHFRKMTKNGKHIFAYIHGNFDDITIPELNQVLKPHVERLAFSSSW